MGTNEPTLMRDFVAAHGRVIYKPTSDQVDRPGLPDAPGYLGAKRLSRGPQ
jgi:hypothetical protein